MTTKAYSRKTSHRLHPRKAKKPSAIRSINLPGLLLSCAVLLLLFLFWQLIIGQREEEKPVRIMAELPSQEMTRELFLEIQDFPGLLHCWAVYSAQAEIRIGRYQASAEILGVDLSTWPLKIKKSAGKKRLGTAPLLVAGEDFFQGLSDEYGVRITKRQAQVFQETLETLDVEITLFFDETAAAGSYGTVPADSGETAPASSDNTVPADSGGEMSAPYADGADSLPGQESMSSFTGSFLALSDGGSLYMDAAQLRGLLKANGSPAGLSRVCLEFQGSQNAENAKKSLTKAGFLAESVCSLFFLPVGFRKNKQPEKQAIQDQGCGYVRP